MPEAAHRLFVAVPLPDPVKEALRVYMEQIKQRLSFSKWIHPADLHMTIQFLGDTPAAKLQAISEAVQKAADSAAPFTLQLAAPGVFGRLPAPSILWLGLIGDLEPLVQLQKRVSSALQPLGFEAETRAFKPHLTVARSYSGSRPFSSQMLRDIPAHSTTGEQISWTVNEIVVYESHLSRKPMYEKVARIPL